MLLSLAVVALLCSRAAALSPTALGWHSPLVGLPSASSFHPEGNYIFTITESNVFAALDPANGLIRWRHQYDEQETVEKYFLCSADPLNESVILRTSSRVESFAIKTGKALWSHQVPGVLGAVCSGEGDVVVHTLDSVVRLSASKGAPVWTWTASEHVYSGTTISSLALSPTDVVVLLASPPPSAYSYITLSSIDGASPNPPLPLALSSSSIGTAIPILLDTTALSYISKDNLYILPLTGKPHSLGGGGYAEIRDVGMEKEGVFVALKKDGKATVFGKNEDGSVGVLWEFSDATPESFFSSFIDTTGIAHIGRLSFSPTLSLGSLQVLTLGETEASPSGLVTGYTFSYDLEKWGKMATFALQALPPKNYVPPTRSFISTASGLLQLREGSKLFWTRNEGLTAIDADLKPVFINLVEGVVKEVLAEGWWDRLERHGDALNAFVLRTPRHHPIDTRHHPQVAILASSPTRSLFGIEATTGKTLWTFFGPEDGGVRVGSWKWLKLAERDGQLEAVARVDGNVERFSLNPETGAVLSQTSWPAEAHTQVVLTPGGAPYTWVEKRGGSLVGVRFEAGVQTEAWTFKPPHSSPIGPIAVQDIRTVASLGRVLGDRSTLFKYLNPHLIAVTSSSSVYLLDTSTGSVIYALAHSAETLLDVSIVLRDNWVLYTHRLSGGLTGVVSVELFEKDGRVVGVQKSFVAVENLKVVGVTRTKLGITSYSALFTADNSQLVAVPRRFLDPRRPVGKPSKSDQEEMLLPYEALLAIDSKWVLTHSLDVKGLKNVASAPGARESESLILGTGLDLFGTSVAPSRSFDVLSESFNKAQLLIAVTALSIALAVVRGMVKSRQVKQAWYTSSS